jgi:RNA-directed DNA polymerase
VLYDKICREDILLHAYGLARANAGAPGVDGISFAQIEERGLETWLAGLGEELVSKRFRPDPVRRVKIPKRDGGGERALGIPTIRDRVVQAAAKIVLEPIFEADFEGTAYGYRPKRGAVDAVKEVHRHLCQCYTDVVNAEGGQRAGSCLAGGRYTSAGNCWQKLAFNFTEPDCPECSPP